VYQFEMIYLKGNFSYWEKPTAGRTDVRTWVKNITPSVPNSGDIKRFIKITDKACLNEHVGILKIFKAWIEKQSPISVFTTFPIFGAIVRFNLSGSGGIRVLWTHSFICSLFLLQPINNYLNDEFYTFFDQIGTRTHDLPLSRWVRWPLHGGKKYSLGRTNKVLLLRLAIKKP
jgi:hypothetical protein